LDSNFCLKLGDCALSRDLFPDDYYSSDASDYLEEPISWMSIEVLKNGNESASTASDIWSCAVAMWECFTFAEQPYSDNTFMIEKDSKVKLIQFLDIDESNRLKRPDNCPKDLFNYFTQCWKLDANERPNLKEMFYSMHKLYNRLESSSTNNIQN
jgi:activated CDC42 kinase 1